MIASKPRRAVAPVELTRHILVYRTFAVAMGVLSQVVTLFSAWQNGSWHHPGLALMGIVILCAGCFGALAAWGVKPSGKRHYGTAHREKFWHEYVYVHRPTGRTSRNLIAFEGVQEDEITIWCYVGSSYTIASGLLMVVGVLMTIAAFGYPGSPI